MSSAHSELEIQKAAAKNLRERTALMKLKIEHQARQNLSLDRSLQDMNCYHFEGETSDLDEDDSVEFSENDNSVSKQDERDYSNTSNASVGARNERSLMNTRGTRDTAVEGERLSLGCQLDCHVEALGLALSNLSGDWSHQSEALAATSVQSLRRIVPDTASVSVAVQDGKG